MKLKFSLFLSSLIIFLSCYHSVVDEYEKIKNEATKSFYINTSKKQQNLLKSFSLGKLKYDEGVKEFKGGFYCILKEDSLLSSYVELNQLFKKNNYFVTENKDSLNYIIVSEAIPLIIGSYSNGGEAVQMETTISIIDMKTEKVYLIKKALGKAPPETIERKERDKYGAVGKKLDEYDIFEILKKVIIVK
ncbi:MAG TPA: hypothetical protein PKZ75_01415 [Bacteroidia bacterium]|nr:hypothetical protein [Bacteroidia bacterium]